MVMTWLASGFGIFSFMTGQVHPLERVLVVIYGPAIWLLIAVLLLCALLMARRARVLAPALLCWCCSFCVTNMGDPLDVYRIDDKTFTFWVTSF